jgi:hypothetical protein
VPRMKRHAVAPVRPLAGDDGSLFLRSNGCRDDVILDAWREWAYRDVVAARRAWHGGARAITWNCSTRDPWVVPDGAVAFDVWPSPTIRWWWEPCHMPPEGPLPYWTPTWDVKAFTKSMAGHLAAVAVWRRAHRPWAAEIVGPLDELVAAWVEIVDVLGGVRGQGEAWQAWVEWGSARARS